MIKLLALDMDGTLLDDQKKISAANIAAIHRAVDAGIKLVLCTGRILSGVKPYFEELGLDADNEFVILNNGCAIHQTSDWSLLDYKALTRDDIDYLNNFSLGYDLPLTLCDIDHYYVVEQEANPDIIEDTRQIFLIPRTINLEATKTHPQPFFLAKFVGHPRLVTEFLEKNDKELSQRFNAVLSQPSIYEMLPKGVSKATALKSLTKKLGLTADQVMAIGDANNDSEMLEYAGLAIAMDNAPNHIKALASDITLSNNDDGVAAAIDKWILNKI